VFVVLASLDNAAIALIPAMILPIAEELHTSEQALAFLTGVTIFVTALTALFWGYWGDRSDRKRLLFYGTLIWVIGALLSATATTYGQLFLWQLLTAVGLGSIASVGFSVVSDLVRPARRGLAMSFWGISQGLGAIAGGLMASQVGADGFRAAFVVIALAGLLFALAYLVAFDVPRGFREPELEGMEGSYDYRISRSDLATLRATPTNRWLILQGLFAQVAYGSLIWVPLLYQEKAIAQGYSTATGTKVGGLYATLITVGALASILGGHLGDRWQRRDLSGRAKLSTIGIWGAIPFFLMFFFIPLRGLEVTDGAGTVTLVVEVTTQLFTNPWVAATFLTGLIALALTSLDSPNWFALIADVNLPEHRGTIFGAGNLANGVGRSVGAALTGAVAGSLERSVPAPYNWAIGLAAFQIFFLPTGYCYWKAGQTCPTDITSIRATLRERADASQSG
jgi:MFS family permease